VDQRQAAERISYTPPASGIVAAFAVAVTDRRERADAYQPRTVEVRYEPDLTPLDATLSIR
jgi:hypothetical protein